MEYFDISIVNLTLIGTILPFFTWVYFLTLAVLLLTSTASSKECTFIISFHKQINSFKHVCKCTYNVCARFHISTENKRHNVEHYNLNSDIKYNTVNWKSRPDSCSGLHNNIYNLIRIYSGGQMITGTGEWWRT